MSSITEKISVRMIFSVRIRIKSMELRDMCLGFGRLMQKPSLSSEILMSGIHLLMS